jgi:hypothetical protein
MKNVIPLLIMLATAITCHAQNVGINNTNPDKPLTIRATGVNNDLLSLRDTNNSSLWQVNILNDGLNVGRTGLPDSRLFLGHNGNLGIGTTNPQDPFHLASNVNGNIARFSTIAGNTAQLVIASGSTEGVITISDNWMLVGTEANPFSKDLCLITGGIQRINIKDSTGNVGIGTANPLEPLSVFSNSVSGTLASFTKDGGGVAKLKLSNTFHETELGMDGFGGFAGTTTNNDFFLRTNGLNRITVTGTTGYVGIGTNLPGTSLAVNGAISATSQTIHINGPSATVNAGNRSYIRINNTGIPQTIITMADGLSDGQLLVIVAQSSGGGAVQFTDAAANNTQLNSSYAMGIDDTLTLIWDATLSKWIELHRSVN